MYQKSVKIIRGTVHVKLNSWIKLNLFAGLDIDGNIGHISSRNVSLTAVSTTDAH